MAIIKCLSSNSSAISLSQIINYAKNVDKTSLDEENMIGYISDKEKAMLVTGLNCDPDLAIEQFRLTKKLWKKNKGVLVHHVIQSFSPDDPITAEEVHKIGVKLAERIAPGFEIVVATHIDKQHLHNHIVINSVSFETGQKYHSSKAHLYMIRQVSNQLCEEKGLAILPEKAQFDRLSMEEIQLRKKGTILWKDELREWIRDALSSSQTKEKFVSSLRERGVKVKWQNKNVSFLHPSMKKFIRGKTLGAEFEIDNLISGLNGNKFIPQKSANRTFTENKEEKIRPIGTVLSSYKTAARQTDLVQYLVQQGYELSEDVKQSGSFRVKDIPGLIVTGNRWYSYPLKTGGNSIDFCMRFQNCNYLESVSKLIGIPIDSLNNNQLSENPTLIHNFDQYNSYLNNKIFNTLLSENKIVENNGTLIFLHQDPNNFTSYNATRINKWKIESTSNTPSAFTLPGEIPKLLVCSTPFSCLRVAENYHKCATIPHFIESGNNEAILTYAKNINAKTVIWPRPKNEVSIENYNRIVKELESTGIAVFEVDKPKANIHTLPNFKKLPNINHSFLQDLIYNNQLYFTESGSVVYNSDKSAYVDNFWSYGSDLIQGWSLPGESNATTLVLTNSPNKLLYSLDHLCKKGIRKKDLHGLSVPSYLYSEAIKSYLQRYPEVKHIMVHELSDERLGLEWMELKNDLEKQGIEVECITYKQPELWASVLDAALFGLEMEVYDEADLEKQRSIRKLLRKKEKRGPNRSK